MWSKQTGTPQDWNDKSFENALGMAPVTQDQYAPILNPLADPSAGVSYTQLRGRQLADCLFSSGHISYDESCWTEANGQAMWLSSNQKYRSFEQAHKGY